MVVNNPLRSLFFVWAILLLGLPFAVAADTANAKPEGIEQPTVQQINHYGQATQIARQRQAMLLVSVEPSLLQSPTPATNVSSTAVRTWLERRDVQDLFASSKTPWVFCQSDINDLSAIQGAHTRLVDHPSLVELRRGPGLFVVDYAHAESGLHGRIVSILPRTPGKYYHFLPAHINDLATLPAGTLTQRSMILAVRIHPERPQSALGMCDPMLASEAAAHSTHQATIGKQGHHNWQSRSQAIAAKLAGAGSPSEVCAESWKDQDLLDSCVDCVASWRQSSGHWNAVRSRQSAYGYDIRRGSSGIWYATGIFAR
ncbi:MAG: hypothetical protein WCI09_01545 [Planctomycetota bacterium]